MGDKDVAGSFDSEEVVNFSIKKNHIIIFLIVVVVLLLAFGGFGIVKNVKDKIFSGTEFCGDGTFYETCSITKPYYCLDGQLIKNSFNCGCPEGFEKDALDCVSDYKTGEKEIILKYILDGEEYFLDFFVYEGVSDYLSESSQSIIYREGEISSRADFKLNKINDEVQREFLLPLVVEIQNIAPGNKDDQARIAISLVQNIRFGSSNDVVRFGGSEFNYSRYPYQVLYDQEGICGEKTELLAFLLRELGYGTSLFYYNAENHEAFGIKCPMDKSYLNSGYCFVETTGPSVITDDEISYVGVGKLDSVPEIFLISDGESFGSEDFYEKSDARTLQKVRSSIEKNGKLNFFMSRKYEKLKGKYGLVDEYFSSD